MFGSYIFLSYFCGIEIALINRLSRTEKKNKKKVEKNLVVTKKSATFAIPKQTNSINLSLLQL